MARHIGTDLYDAFVAVAETGGFTAAVERLHRTQTTISQQIKRLEALLETELFVRTNRNVELTAAGEAMLPYARKILSLNEQATAAVNRAEEDMVTIGVPDLYTDAVLPGLIDVFQRFDSRIVPIVYCDDSNALLEQFSSGAIDIVLSARCTGSAPGRAIRTENLAWVGSPAFEWHADRCLPVILSADGCPIRAHAIDALGESTIPWETVYVGHCSRAVTPSLSHGLGVSALPSRTIPSGLVPVGDKFGLPEIKAVSVDLHVATAVCVRYGEELESALAKASAGAFAHKCRQSDAAALAGGFASGEGSSREGLPI